MTNRRVLFLLLGGCGSATTPSGKPITPPAIAEPADGPIPALRTGALPTTDDPKQYTGTVARAGIEDSMETVEVVTDISETLSYNNTVVSLGGSAAFVFPEWHDNKVTLWLRRPATAAGTPLVVDLYRPSEGDQGGTHMHLRADDPVVPGANPEQLLAWETAFANAVGSPWGVHHGVWNAFAGSRLASLSELTRLRIAAAQPPPPPPPRTRPAHPVVRQQVPPPRPAPAMPTPPPPRRASSSELAGLMATSTGVLAVQEALQHDRELFRTATEPQTIAIAQVVPPKLAAHPWDKMTKRLAIAPPAERLAEAVPAEFYYVRATTFDAFEKLLDQVDAWGTPVAQVLDNDPTAVGVSQRYEAELGVSRGPLSRMLGGKVIGELAVTGSDPYLREGSDVTLVFRVKDHTVFATALASAVTEHGRTHGAITSAQLTLAGVPVAVARSADGTVRQHRATLGDLEFVSNSPGALARVLAAAQQKRPRLADELDFKYMLARDAKQPADVLAYMGDRFVAEVIGPKQKIGEARRQLALGELMTPGFAALLYGYMYGRSPRSTEELVAAHLLEPGELAHATGAAIAWQPGKPARSSWGTPAEMMPLIDLPDVAMVTDSERQSYQRFANGYEHDWQTYIDPIAVRLAIAGHALTMDLRELPLIDGSGYNEIEREAGDARFDVAALASGARAVLALGEDSWIRRTLSQTRGLFSEHKVQFDWVGSFATIGVLDRAQVAASLLALDDHEVPQLPAPRHRADEFKELTQLPAYAEIAVKNPLGATAALTGLRAFAMQSVPNMLTWGESETYRDVPIVKIAIDAKKAKAEFDADVELSVYYALTHGALVIALSQSAIHTLVDARLDGKAATATKGTGTQLALDFTSGKGRALWSCFAWLAEGELVHRNRGTSYAMAEALFRGAPDRASDAAAMHELALAYFGAAPIAADGGTFTWAPEGLVDPARGSDYARRYPPLPVPGSPVEALMRVIGHSRAELSFDDEGADDANKPMRSLHARVTTTVE